MRQPSKSSTRIAKETKYLILFGFYVGFWGVLQSLTVKLAALDLSFIGAGVLAFSFGSIAHALTFPCTDVVAEIWGAKRARLMVYMGLVVYSVSTLMLYLATLAPPAEGWPLNQAYIDLFSSGPRILLASICATAFAQLWDIYVFEKIKSLTGQKHLWLRNCLSTFGSQLFDTSIFYLIAFYGILPGTTLISLILGAYSLKLAIAVIDTPIVYLLVYSVTGKWSYKADTDKHTQDPSPCERF